jgi:hypothetical protein
MILSTSTALARSAWLLVGVALPALAAPAAQCAAAAPAAVGASSGQAAPKQSAVRVLIGPVTREQVEAAAPGWVQAGIESKPDLGAAQALATVPPGAEVTVFLGTWCPDSRREVARFWQSLDQVGATAEGGAAGGLPFTLRYIGVDEGKKEPAEAVLAANVRWVPTFIVRRDGREVGRIVEESPHGIEADLLALLNGTASGLVTASSRAASQGSAPPHR